MQPIQMFDQQDIQTIIATAKTVGVEWDRETAAVVIASDFPTRRDVRILETNLDGMTGTARYGYHFTVANGKKAARLNFIVNTDWKNGECTGIKYELKRDGQA